ncbi:MAG TPA: hypothetical protein VF268_05880, partial [Gammaproteobacteria bacterium]
MAMNDKRIWAAGVFGSLILLGAIIAYILTFGTQIADSHERWAQFGDYFGGILNPIFAFLAFLLLLWTIKLQISEFHSASEFLSEQVKAANEQLSLLKEARIREDLLYVMKDIDRRLDESLKAFISPPSSNGQLTVSHMVSESHRI